MLQVQCLDDDGQFFFKLGHAGFEAGQTVFGSGANFFRSLLGPINKWGGWIGGNPPGGATMHTGNMTFSFPGGNTNGGPADRIDRYFRLTLA